MNPQTLQILRTIDKLDRVGLEGVKKLLGDGLVDQSGAKNDGCGLRPIQIEFIVQFLKCKGADNQDVLAGLADLFDRTARRFALIEMLEDGASETAWDRLIALPAKHRSDVVEWRPSAKCRLGSGRHFRGSDEADHLMSRPFDGRCPLCDWPLAKPDDDSGCRVGDCGFRPSEGSPDALRITARLIDLRTRIGELTTAIAEQGRAIAANRDATDMILLDFNRLVCERTILRSYVEKADA